MTKQIDELMALADEYADWVEYAESRQALQSALEAALGQPQAVPASSLKPGESLVALFREAIEWGITYTPELSYSKWSKMREQVAQSFADRAAPPAQTPMQKIDIPPGMADPLDVVYVEGWNAACEKFGNPVFEPTPALVIEVTKEAASPAQTPPPRLTDDEWRKVYKDYLDDEECNVSYGKYIETAVRKQFGVNNE